MDDQATIVFFKRLVFGKVKTRLASQVGHRAALLFYQAMIRDLVRNLDSFSGKIVAFEENSEEKPEVELASLIGFSPLLQRGGDLGERMCEAFKDVFKSGVKRALLIGSDIPHVTAPIIELYFSALNNYPLVIGPAEDGGYYLIGFTRHSFSEYLFRDVDWGTASVLERTIRNANKTGLRYYLGEKKRDIDRLDDLVSVLNDPSTAGLLTETCAVFAHFR